MRIEVYRAANFRDVPQIVPVTFDNINDSYLAAFDNYPGSAKLVVVGWTAQGFRVVAPPADMPADEAVTVLAWGELPEASTAQLHARGLSWRLNAHRSGQA
jgi:hypothetical protein